AGHACHGCGRPRAPGPWPCARGRRARPPWLCRWNPGRGAAAAGGCRKPVGWRVPKKQCRQCRTFASSLQTVGLWLLETSLSRLLSPRERNKRMANKYAEAGVDTAAGDLAVELMKAAVTRTHGPQVFGGVGGFAGLFDVSYLKGFERPLLATSTDGVGTKVAIAQAMDKHDTIGQDLVGMVVDDIVVVGARPLFMTDYIACGKVVPQRIADIVAGIARGCEQTGTALVGGETAEHPGLLGPHDYDVAGAATGVVEADAVLGAERVRDG